MVFPQLLTVVSKCSFIDILNVSDDRNMGGSYILGPMPIQTLEELKLPVTFSFLEPSKITIPLWDSVNIWWVMQ